MRSGALPITAWGAGLVALAVMGAVGFGLDLLPTLLLASAGAAAAATGVAAGATERRSPRDARFGRPDVVLTGSAAATAATAGLVIGVFGLAAGGPAFTWPGAAILAVGLGGVVRERRAARALLADEEDRRR